MNYNHDNMNESNKIICNYLPQSLSDHEFHDLFSKYGTIIQSNIVRSKNNYSYGFGFVTFASSKDADRAIAELNGLELKNKKIKVAYSRPQGEDIKKAKLYIKNVPQISVEKLNEIFSKYGTIIQSNIATNKGIAFILYDKREQAEKAIESLNDAVIIPGSLPIKIKFATSNNNNNNHQNNLRQMRPQYNNNNNYNNNYNNNRQTQFQNNNNNNYNFPNNSRPKNNNYQNSYQNSSSSSSNYYDRMQTDDYNNSTNNQYNKSRNNNFQYSNKSSNRYNPINMNKNYNQNSNNYQIPIQQSYEQTTNRNNYQTNVQTSNDNILFVYNIGMNTEEQLFNLFSKFGQILKSNVLRKKNLAFIQMNNYDDCLNAIENLNDYILNGCKLQVSFKK